MEFGAAVAPPKRKKNKRPRLTIDSTVELVKTTPEVSSERTEDMFGSPSPSLSLRCLQKQKWEDPLMASTADEDCMVTRIEPPRLAFPEVTELLDSLFHLLSVVHYYDTNVFHSSGRLTRVCRTGSGN